jgi:hypothetical protein
MRSAQVAESPPHGEADHGYLAEEPGTSTLLD